jgi:aminomuconate-semialdehyde/2-hydroxymuconate-6-semialdehyde dehydrogenase
MASPATPDFPFPFPHVLNFVDGAFAPAAAGQTLPNADPSTGAVSGSLPRSSAVDVRAAVAAASRALPGWRATPLEARAALLDRVAALLERAAPALAALEAADAGKTLAMARATDIPRAVANLRFFAGAARHDAAPGAFAMHDAVSFATRESLGVVALVTPWNLPLYLLTWKVAPALVMGNTIVAKPSEITPVTATALAAAFAAAGAPPGVFNLVHGLGAEVGDALTTAPAVRAVSFTGGTATGRVVAAAAAPLFKKLSLELGGKNATIIFGDVPLATAVAAALRAGYTNNGQVCLCGSRVFVETSIFDAFCAAFGAAVRALRVGAPLADGTDVGPLSSAAHRDKVARFIALGVEEGGEVLAGGPGAPDGLAPELAGGFYVRPTAFRGLDHATSRVAREEIFGPVVTVHPFSGEAEAVALANDSVYGLAANVWTENVGVAHRVARALEVGTVWVNTWLHRDLRVPFGGVKDSGTGREGGAFSLDFYSEWKTTCIKMGPPS